MRTYAIAWVHPNRKLSTRIDNKGHNNPTWNEKFAFRVNDDFLYSETSTVTVEIFAVAWFRDVLVGSVRVLVNDLVQSSVQTQSNSSVRFVALQIRRSNGTPQGILNMGVSLINSAIRSMPLCREFGGSITTSSDDNNIVNKLITLTPNRVEDEDAEKEKLKQKVELWRSRSAGTELPGSVCNGSVINGSVCNGPVINGSVCNGSMVNGSELCSDVGPSASIVAAEIADRWRPLFARPNPYTNRVAADPDPEGSVLDELTSEEAAARGWRRDLPAKNGGKHARRRSDGGGFRCFAYGLEFTIVCGAADETNNHNNSKIIPTSNKKKSNKKDSV
jgi:hypothetical protein